MTMMTYAEAIREGMSIRMREDPNVVLFGEDDVQRRVARLDEGVVDHHLFFDGAQLYFQ